MKGFTVLVAAALACVVASTHARTTVTTMSYQGVLQVGGAPAQGTFHLRFQLWDALTGGVQTSLDLDFPAVQIADGLFTVPLDFGVHAFDGSPRWLQVQVISDGGSTVTTLSPRQPLTSAPFSIQTRGIHVSAFGNVGIGTESQGAKLHIREGDVGATANLSTLLRLERTTSNILAMLTPADVVSGIVFGRPGGSNGDLMHGGFFYNDGDALGGLKIVTGGAQTRMVIDQLGAVGIGTVTPDTKLHVFKSSAGFVTAHSNSALAVESSGPTYLSVLSANTSERALVFGEPSHNAAAGIFYNNSLTPNGLQFRTNGNITRMVISDTGAVGLGTVSPGFQLHLSTNSAAKPTSNTWTISSDARLKKNIQPIAHALDDLLALRGVTYQWKDPESQGNMSGTYTGMIAQDVEQVFPEWVSEDARGYKHLTVIGFEGLVVEALRELRTEKDTEIAQLRLENADLRKRLEALEAIILESPR